MLCDMPWRLRQIRRVHKKGRGAYWKGKLDNFLESEGKEDLSLRHRHLSEYDVANVKSF